jgi:hypothetical protein
MRTKNSFLFQRTRSLKANANKLYIEVEISSGKRMISIQHNV